MALTGAVTGGRKRKEWSRFVDERGRRGWLRHRIAGNDDRSDGYVMQFDMQRHLQPLREPDPVTSDAKELTSPRTETANAAFSAALGYQMSKVRLELLDAMGADPMKLPHDVFGSNGNTFSLATSVPREDLYRQAVELAAKDFPTKYEHFSQQAAQLRESHASFQALRNATKCPPFVRSDYLLEQSLELVTCVDECVIQSSSIPVTLIDHFTGKVSNSAARREWLAKLSSQISDPLVGLFRVTNHSDRSYFINPTVESVLGDDHLLYYYSAGRLVGHMMLNGDLLDFHLSVPLLKMILGTPISFSDLEYLDEEKYRNLLWLLDHDDVHELELDFTVNERSPCGGVETIELIPAGRNIQVNDDNKYEYIDRVFRYALFESVSTQVCVFLKGLYEAVPQDLLMLFDYEELDFLLCGSDTIDINDWQHHTIVEGDASVTLWFWEIIAAMSADERRLVLHFTTGSARVPIVGFRGLKSSDGRPCPFSLKVVSGASAVSSHACFNSLELPAAASRPELEAAIMAAI